MAFAPRIPPMPRSGSSSRRGSLGRPSDSIQPPPMSSASSTRRRSTSLSINNTIGNDVVSDNNPISQAHMASLRRLSGQSNPSQQPMGPTSTSALGGGGQQQQQRKLKRSVSNAQDVLAKFHATQQEYDTQETLKQTDRLQQRLLWKEQMERSSALETQIMTNKRTMANLERQLESLKRELATERQTFDTDLAQKESKLEDAKRSLENKKRRFDTTQAELRDTNSAIARMRAVLVEHFVLTKSYSSKPDIDDPFYDVTGEDYKFYKIYAGAELEKRHQLLIERYIGGSALDKQQNQRALSSDPLASSNNKDSSSRGDGGSADHNRNRRLSTRDQKRRSSLYSSSAADEEAYFAAKAKEAEEEGKGFKSKRKGYDPKNKTKALNEVREMLLELEKEMFETENEASPGSNSKASSPRKDLVPKALVELSSSPFSTTQEDGAIVDVFTPTEERKKTRGRKSQPGRSKLEF